MFNLNKKSDREIIGLLLAILIAAGGAFAYLYPFKKEVTRGVGPDVRADCGVAIAGNVTNSTVTANPSGSDCRVNRARP